MGRREIKERTVRVKGGARKSSSASDRRQAAPAASKGQPDPTDPVRSIVPHVARWLQRSERLAERIDEAFAGQPFLPHLPATAPRNLRRFRAYYRMHKQGMRMLQTAIDEWLRIHGLQDLAAVGLAALQRQQAEGDGGTSAPRQPTQADLLVAQQFAQIVANPDLVEWNPDGTAKGWKNQPEEEK